MKNVKSTWRKFLLLAFVVWLVCCPVSGQLPPMARMPKESVSWPPQIERIAEDLYKNKVAAMAVYNMRLREYDEKAGRNDYVRGKAFLQAIQELGEAADDKLLEKAKEIEDSDFIAKLIVLARDRKARPEHYETISSYYIVYDYQRPMRENDFRPVRTISPTVLQQHRTEEWRLPLEYGFFAPPSGPPPNEDLSRWNLYNALRELKTPGKTGIIMLADATSVDAHIESPELHEQQLLGIRYVVNHPDPKNAEYLESVLSGPKSHHYRKRILETSVWPMPETTEEAITKRLVIWQLWVEFFKSNPELREKAKLLAELFEKAADEEEKKQK